MSFSTPIHYQENSKSHAFLNYVEDYFNFGKQKFFVYKSSENTHKITGAVLETEQKTQKELILKVLTYVTIVMPLFIFFAKVAFRLSHSISVVDPKVLLGKGISDQEADFSRKVWTRVDLDQHLNQLSSKHSHLTFEVGGEEVDNKIEQLAFVRAVQEIHGLGCIIIPPAKKVELVVDHKKVNVLVRGKIEVVDPSKKDGEFDEAAKKSLHDLVKLVHLSGIDQVKYAHVDVSKQGDYVLNGIEGMNVSKVIKKHDGLNSLHGLLSTMPKTQQMAALKILGFRTEAVFNAMDPKDAGILYDMLNVVNTIFNAHGIRYWGCSGTLLGVARNHGGIIPWDDDIDTEVFEEDKDKILKLNSEFNRYGYQITENEMGLKIVQLGSKTCYPGLDIFLAKKDTVEGEERYYFANPIARKRFPKEYWLPQELANFKEVPFGPYKIWVPDTDWNRHLTKIYGKDWSYVGYRIWDHVKNKFHRKERVYLTKFEQVAYELPKR